jgi:nucleoside-diphosphate-sugar epimerase
MKKTVFVIGANSALARAVLPALAKDNTIITAGRKDCDVYCDVTESVALPDGADVIINFAASFGGTSDEAITTALQTNVLGTLRICTAAKKADVSHIVNISSIFTLVDETSPSYSIYAVTKRQADELALFYCKLNKIPLTILRPSRIYGDSSNFEKNQPFLYHLLDKAYAGEDILLYGTNDASRNYIHSDDLAEIIVRVVAQRTEGVYDCTYPHNVTYSQIAQAAQRLYNHGGQVKFLDDKPNIPDDTFPLDQSLYAKIGYRPSLSIESGIERLQHYKKGRVT